MTYAISIGLLALSNIFMTIAWYGHLKFKAAPIWIVIIISWGIALFEYILQVPANRIGHSVMSAAQLKAIQEVITLIVFVAFAYFYLKENIGWNTILGFVFIGVGAFLIFKPWG